MIEYDTDQQRGGQKVDQLLSCLSDRTRRRVLIALTEHNPRKRVRVRDEFQLADLTPVERERDQFNIELYHNHLPRLNDTGFIDWDRDSDTITRGPRFEDIEPLLRLLDDHQDELPADWP